MSDTVTLSAGEAEELVAAALVASDVSAANAAEVAAALVAAEADGQKGHGLSRVLAYAAQARSGKVAGEAVPTVATPRPGLVAVDAGFGFAFPALAKAREAIAARREQGVIAALVRNSHHCGALGLQVEKLAEAGFVAMMFANTPKAMAPWGGSEALFGTNPIAFAAPVPEGAPLVIDLSLSKVARGKVMAAAQRGEPIPEGWALDVDGAPTTDPRAALVGTMIPAGDAKGAALALMVEVLAGALVGPNFSFEASSFFDAEGPPPGVAQLIVALDAEAMAKGALARTAQLLEAVEAQGARVPGTRRLAAREAARREGIAVPRQLHEDIVTLAQG